MDVTSSNRPDDHSDDQYQELEKLLNRELNFKLFTTDANDRFLPRIVEGVTATLHGEPLLVEGLFRCFLEELPVESRQHYNCNSCRKFINGYGHLALVSTGTGPYSAGTVTPAIWPLGFTVPEFFQDAISHLFESVSRAKVTGVFYTEEKIFGTPKTSTVTGPVWTHLHATNKMRLSRALKTPFQATADAREEHTMVMKALVEFPLEIVEKAVAVLDAEALYRSEKVIGVARWFQQLHEVVKANPKKRSAIVWAWVADAPPGYAHIRSTMIGTLLEDLANSEMEFSDAVERFNKKMHPLQYRRTTVAPSEGNIKQAEAIMEKLGVASALKRRFARLEELQLMWSPVVKIEVVEDGRGLFDHLRKNKKNENSLIELQETPITWTRFVEKFLPAAEEIWLRPTVRGNYGTMITAEDPTSLPIFQWDSLENRNPFSWYMYIGGSYAKDWNIRADWTRVTGIAKNPALWPDPPLKNHGRGVVMVLEGARDLLHETGGGIFTEDLKPEFHPIRHTIEAHVKVSKISGVDESSASGLMLGASSYGAAVKVKIGEMYHRFLIDREV